MEFVKLVQTLLVVLCVINKILIIVLVVYQDILYLEQLA